MPSFEACQRNQIMSFSRRRRGAVLVERFWKIFPRYVIMPKKGGSSC